MANAPHNVNIDLEVASFLHEEQLARHEAAEKAKALLSVRSGTVVSSHVCAPDVNDLIILAEWILAHDDDDDDDDDDDEKADAVIDQSVGDASFPIIHAVTTMCGTPTWSHASEFSAMRVNCPACRKILFPGPWK